MAERIGTAMFVVFTIGFLAVVNAPWVLTAMGGELPPNAAAAAAAETKTLLLSDEELKQLRVLCGPPEVATQPGCVKVLAP